MHLVRGLYSEKVASTATADLSKVEPYCLLPVDKLQCHSPAVAAVYFCTQQEREALCSQKAVKVTIQLISAS